LKLISARIPKSEQLQQESWLSWNLLIAASAFSASSSELKIRLLLNLGHVALPCDDESHGPQPFGQQLPYVRGSCPHL